MSKLQSQQKATVVSGPAGKITVLNPACSSTRVEHASLTQRRFSSLNDKTIFLVDIGWGGPKAGYDVLEVIQAWFAGNIPSAKTVLIAKKGPFAEDDPELWERARVEADACVIGISC